ncbi:MAG: hypothetical protein JXR70_14960 [Spirochaetales bacterium]|nr:hypothetical protein [Spirochaetales bacterium]
MNKFSIIFLSILLIFLATGLYSQNLIMNPSFETNFTGEIDHWGFDQYNKGASDKTVEKANAQDGNQYAVIKSQAKNDARLYQMVFVEPETTYEISGWIKTSGVQGGIIGANINLIDQMIITENFQGDNEEWKQAKIYIKTEKDVSLVKIGLALGWYGAENTGTACFDNIIMKAVDSVPEGQLVHRVTNVGQSDSSQQKETTPAFKLMLPLPDFISMVQELVFILLGFMTIAAYLVYLYFFDKEKLHAYPEIFRSKFKSFITLPDLKTKGLVKGILFSKWFKALVFIVIALVFLKDLQIALATDPIPGNENHYIHQAIALFEGRIDIGHYLHDTAEFNGKIYVIYPPFPLLLILPFVAIWGLKTKLTLVAIYISVIAAFLLVRILQKIKIEAKTIPWVLAAFFFGTGFFLCLRNSLGVAWFAHVAAVFALIVMLYFALVKGNAFLTGLFLGFAFLSRQLSIWMAIFAFVAIWQFDPEAKLKKKMLKIIYFGASFAICIALYLLFNYLRFGDIFDTGYTYLQLSGFMATRADTYGQFSWHHIPFNFVYMFLQGFHINYGDWPDWATSWHEWWALDPFGTSITFASPFVFFAFWGRIKDKWIHWAAWLSILGSLVHQLMYYNNGWVQFNAQRFSLDFLPLLILLVALGFDKCESKYWKPLVMVAILLNAMTFLLISPPG